MWGTSTESQAHQSIARNLKPAFNTLLKALAYASNTCSGRWDFAVAIDSFKELGLSETDLRWLVRSGYVEHALETTKPEDFERQFRETVNLSFCKKTCFVLTEAGISIANVIAEVPMPNHPHVGNRDHCLKLPSWNAQTRELSLGDKIVKRFKWQAINQEVVLGAFEEDGWPARIDNPLPPHAGQSCKRRLSDTIKCLNRKQSDELLHFRGDGTGEGVVWEFADRYGARVNIS